MLFALGRDGILARDLADVEETTGTPAVALAFELGVQLCLIVAFAIAGTRPINVFFYLATIGILNLLVMYIVTNLGALRYLFLSRRRRAPLWEIVLPVCGIGFAVYTLYKNLWPVPEPSRGATALVGPVADQAHLFGVLERVRSLGLELLRVEVVCE
jgi:amino acid transporter